MPLSFPSPRSGAERLVEVNGFSVPARSSVIHFYYSKQEQQRLAGFLLDGIARHEAVVLACTHDSYQVLQDGLEMLGVGRSEPGLTRLEITPDLPNTVARIGEAVSTALQHHACARVLADFGSMVGQEGIFELEGLLSAALSGLNLVCVSQYDGRNFGAPVTIEQFQTHALAIVGNAFFRENKNYTSPDAYYRKRAVGGQR